MSNHARTPRRNRLNVDSGLESLQASAEFLGPVEPLDEAHRHHCNDHLALIHESRDELFEAVVPFLRTGLEAGEKCLYVLEDASRDAIAAALRRGGVDVDDALESGRLSFRSVEETYLRGGTFRPDEMIEFYREAIAEATDEYGGLRVTAETGWLLDESTDVESWMVYESRVNDLFAETDCVALCQYDRTRLPAELLRDLVQTHPHIVYDGMVCHNFYYTPPEEFLGPAQPDNEVDRMMRTLVDRTRAKATLRERGRYLRNLYDVTADADRCFDEQLEAVLELGRERFDLAFGGLAHVDPGRDTFQVEYASGTDCPFEPGVERRLSETHCAETAAVREITAVVDPAVRGDDEVATPRSDGPESYLGNYLEVDGAPDRTLFFAGPEPREEPFSEDERTFLRIVSQWVTYELQQRQRKSRLDALNSLNRSLMTAESVTEVIDAVLDAADSLGFHTASVGRYHPDEGELRSAGRTGRDAELLRSLSPFETARGIGWEAFLRDEIRRSPVGDRGDSAARPAPDLDVLAVPLNESGVLVALLPADAADGDVEFVRTVAASVTTALDRAHRESELHAREATLQERNEALTRLDRINTTIRNIDKALVSASSRSEIESVVCEELTDAGPYTFAWIGKHDPLTDELTPRVRAGLEDGYLQEVPVDDAGPTTLADRAAAAGEIQVVNDLFTDAASEPWRQEALTRGYHAAVALPLAYEDTTFGILTVFADQPGVFDDLEETVLGELGDNIAHAINAVENKRSLVSNDVTELTFEVPVDELAFGELVEATGGTYHHEGVVAGGDGKLRWFFSTRDADPDAVVAWGSGGTGFSIDRIDGRADGNGGDGEAGGGSEGGDGAVFEVRLACESLPAAVLEHGGRIHGVEAADGIATVTVDLHTGTDVREFVEMFRTKYPGAGLIAKHDRERPLQTLREFRSVLSEALTPRQREVLQTAYYSGYFEEPRTRTAGEIAASMDISQPTFTSHLRTAERKVYGELLEELE